MKLISLISIGYVKLFPMLSKSKIYNLFKVSKSRVNGVRVLRKGSGVDIS